MWVFNFIIVTAAFVLILPVAVLLLQVIASPLSSKGKFSAAEIAERPTVVVLMPAHNESLVIEKPIKSVLAQLKAHDKLLVVADNCSDDTAAIAKKWGASVVERNNLQQRGKGYALDFGLQSLNNNPPQVVLILDADCIVAENAINLLVSACVGYQRPVQALYIMESQPNPTLKARIAEFAWIVKNKVRPSGSNAFGLPCQLMGTGMAFLWSDISKTNLASGHIVEDMKLGIDLARLNKAPIFLSEALVTSVFPPTQEATNTQRARWEHGHLSVILSEAPGLFAEAIKHKNLQMFGLACDLIVPPLAVLAMLCGGVFLLSLLVTSKLALLLSSGLLASLFLTILLAWIFYGRQVISFAQLCYAPIYALIKIPLYFKFFFNRQVDWVRSKRD